MTTGSHKQEARDLLDDHDLVQADGRVSDDHQAHDDVALTPS